MRQAFKDSLALGLLATWHKNCIEFAELLNSYFGCCWLKQVSTRHLWDYGAPNCFKVLVAAECILLLTYGTYLVARQNESTKQCAYVQLRIAEKAETN